jgi:segregation and condensation protein B
MGSDMARGKTEFDDAELDELPQDLRWREYMGRVEAVLFAAPEPVTREALARVVGENVAIEALIDDIREELRGRPYEIVFVAGGWRFQTRKKFAPFIRAAAGAPVSAPLSETQARVVTAIAYFQPLTRAELSLILGREISRDGLATLRQTGLIGAGPRSPRAGAPVTYVTTGTFLERFGLASLRDLPDMDKLEDEGLLSKDALFSGELARAFGIEIDEPNEAEEDVATDLAEPLSHGEED